MQITQYLCIYIDNVYAS